MFATKEASKDAQWHKFNQQPGSKEMSNPADGEAWQHFDKEFPDFAMDARNLRLGLATDRFNPFSEKKHKIQHVACVCCAIQPSTLGLYAGVKLYDDFAYSRSFITRKGF
jgi:hypothetical protein